MAEFLSQDEIDALLNMAEEGESNLEEAIELTSKSKKKSYTIYDFKKPNLITTDQLKAFNTLHEKLVRNLVTEISSMMRKIVEVKLVSIEQMTYGEFILSIPPVTSLNTLSMKPLEGKLILELNPSIAHKIIAELLGNGDSYVPTDGEKELTDIELEILDHFYAKIIEQMFDTWEEIATLNFKSESKDTTANAIQIISNHEVVLLVVIEITIDNEVGNLSICYPIAYIEPILNKIVQKLLGSARKKKASRKEDLHTLLAGAKMFVEAIIAETNMNVKEILSLKKDDIIVFNKDSRSKMAKVYINKKEKFATEIGIYNNRKAVKILYNIDHEKMQTLEKLKEIREQREKKEKEAREKIAKLLETKDEILNMV